MEFPVRASNALSHLYRALCLVALLIAGQQGAVVHELGHLAGAQSTDLQAGAGEVTDSRCALCPLFAQVAAAAFSHAFPIPFLLRAGIDPTYEPPVDSIGAAVPTPRSRGPPSLG
jgi:hypothetical protein